MAESTKIMRELKKILMIFGERYIDSDGNVSISKVQRDLENYDPKLISELLKSSLIRENYVQRIDNINIFKVDQFEKMFQYKNFWEDSYTRFSNKIGLTADDKFIDDSNDVVLDFPFKDCVLKGGMNKEDSKNNNEVFLNEVIAKPEIDELLEPKILKNAVKYYGEGEKTTSKISNDDNLILKGNNLVGLYSIKRRYAGKVKSILIDPPYYFSKDKQSDSFNYNSNFKLSTWLTFMRNRLEIARSLLRDDGFCIITIGIEGYSYLKLIADEIFGKENNLSVISWRKSDNQANIGTFAQVTDYILMYTKKNGVPNRLPLSDKAKKEYRYEDEKGKFRRGTLLDRTRGKHIFDLKTPSGKILKGPWMKNKDEIERLDNKNLIYWTSGGKEQPYSKTYLKNSKGQIPNDFWDTSFGTNQRGATEISKLFNDRVFDFPKPERLIFNLLTLSTDKNDIVLDFFMGSATTQAVAMKMHRRFIGIEQMDYIKSVSVERLKKVINGEQGGISKDVDWHGGGSFVYAELMDKNIVFLRDAQKATNKDELEAVYKRMKENADLDFRLDLDKYETEKDKLTFKKQQETLIRMIDKNQLYYNEANIDDAKVRDLLSDSDYQFNKNFYDRED